MQYVISFLEGIITFVSPCILPMLPVYISYFAGGESNRKRTLTNALGFVLGFTIVFVLLGAFAGVIGSLLQRYETIVNMVTGGVVIILGLNFTGIINISFLNGSKKAEMEFEKIGFGSSVLFGIVFSIGWTPLCRCFFGFCIDDGIPAGHCGCRNMDADTLFGGLGNSVCYQCTITGPPEGCLSNHKEKLSDD